MFTGIIAGIGELIEWRSEAAGGRWIVSIPAASAWNVGLGDSISINGTCLTVVEMHGSAYHFQLLPETIEKSTWKTAKAGDRVNTEPAMRLSDRLGGHWVTGHVDGTLLITNWVSLGDTAIVTCELPEWLTPFIAPKGSITLDGVALTVVDVMINPNWFTVHLIPSTIQSTCFLGRSIGSSLNVEFDGMARYLYQFYQNSQRGLL